jgi:hypothetical protein
MAAQKTLIQQLQESEAEARELQDFLQVEIQPRIWRREEGLWN